MQQFIAKGGNKKNPFFYWFACKLLDLISLQIWKKGSSFKFLNCNQRNYKLFPQYEKNMKVIFLIKGKVY